ncbi:hypothetical protein KOR42_44420 [Thalassoglobus neptunius]|uniref:Squalene cyclase C-terminal domain-containing protein n=1 Tax=Thalassoglobus neptunius TaxID=1938619 RepID=A0A5C5W1B5_9PLAN|nr:prenyltransferase/squalene oxidase repeat-containing protein [Thalassoglobus neptunius]TWT43562.1 hypothetical protein KOR42_44420 [Thalassoglobus neptunius]
MIVNLVFTLAVAAIPAQVGESSDSVEAKRSEIVQKGLAFLREQGQEEDGSLSARVGSGVTSLAVAAGLKNGLPLSDPLVARGLSYLEGKIQPNGGIYSSDRLRNYETCVAIMALAEANSVAGDGRYDTALKNAGRFVRGLQVGVDDEISESDSHFGGVGYSGKERPDLSNTAFFIEALKSLDTPPDDPAILRALVFVSRCQNLDAQWNDTVFADKVKDGGFYYVIPTETVDPSASERYTENGGLRSYGSMSYAGFKSLVYAGLEKDDPRAKAVLEWISANYSLQENPGQGIAGLYYYFHTFGTALDASGLEVISTPDGEKDWRTDLVLHLGKSQRPDGSWVNENRQWFENDANLCTAFALLSLSHAKGSEE